MLRRVRNLHGHIRIHWMRKQLHTPVWLHSTEYASGLMTMVAGLLNVIPCRCRASSCTLWNGIYRASLGAVSLGYKLLMYGGNICAGLFCPGPCISVLTQAVPCTCSIGHCHRRISPEEYVALLMYSVSHLLPVFPSPCSIRESTFLCRAPHDYYPQSHNRQLCLRGTGKTRTDFLVASDSQTCHYRTRERK